MGRGKRRHSHVGADSGLVAAREANDPVVDDEGVRRWFLDGELHRVGGPAIERPNGTRSWWLNGKRHRENGPAIEWADGAREWYRQGDRHREGGPAIEWANGTRSWWLNGQELSEADYAEAVARLYDERAADSVGNVVLRPSHRGRMSALAA